MIYSALTYLLPLAREPDGRDLSAMARYFYFTLRKLLPTFMCGSTTPFNNVDNFRQGESPAKPRLRSCSHADSSQHIVVCA